MTPDDKDRLVAVLDEADEMSLATVRDDGFPQATTVAFVNDGLTLWFGTSPDSQKAANLAGNDKVSATVCLPYDVWEDIVGLSIGARAARVVDADERQKVSQLVFEKFPQVENYVPPDVDDASVAFFRLDPVALSLIDYHKGFGHVEYFDV